MNIEKAIEKFKELESVVVDGATFVPTSVEEIQVETGDIIYWVEDGGGAWLSLDPEGDEVILFSKLEEVIDSSGDTAYFNGSDYEFEYESVAFILDDGEKSEKIHFKDFASEAEIMRFVENTVTAVVETSLGKKITDEDLRDE